MLSKITLNNIGSAFKTRLMLLSMFLLLGGILHAQTTITTSYALTNAASTVTFNIKNNNTTPVVITGIGSVLNLGPGVATDVAAYFNPVAVSAPPGDITVAPGWTSFGTATISSNGDNETQSFLTGTSLTIPAGATYGIAVTAFPAGTNTSGALIYNNPATGPGGTNTVSSICGVDFITGTNIGFGGNGVLTATPRRFIGSITYNTAPCTGTPAPGNTVSSVSNVCSGVNFTLSLQNCVSNSGLSFRWQRSSTLTGTYTDIPGGTAATLTTSQTAATYYRSVVTCGGNSANSTPVLVSPTSPSTLCYCAAGALSTAGEKIEHVTFGDLDNTSSSTAGYESFISRMPTDSFVAGGTYPIDVTTSNPWGTDRVQVWIDFNHNGSFSDPGEAVYISSIGVGPYSGTITIPATAMLGLTGMRVRLHDTDPNENPNATPCGNSNWGQVEDYYINIKPCVPVSITTQPVNSTISCGGNATFTVAATGTGITYQWQQRNSTTSQWNNLTNSGVYSGVTSNTLTLSNVPVTANGYQYRVVYTGACSGTDFTSVDTLRVNKLVATVSPASSTVCSGGVQQLRITNTDAPTTTSFCSGPVNIQIPDRTGPPASSIAVTDAGINHSIPVTIPAGAVISALSVKFNITHAYSGDLVIVLKAPNGKVLNLNYHKSGEGTGGANFTNTVISSTGTASLGAGTAPYTGVFKADASIGAGAFGDPSGSGPTNFQPDVTTFADLYSVPNGNWTIAAQDPSTWGGDIGVLNDWCIDVTYGAPSTGVFSGTGLFTNAAATTPYTGTAVNSVFAKPAATTTYSVVVTNPACVTDTTFIPVTVSFPITAAGTVANRSVCRGENTSFSATSTPAGNAVSHQWKVSTNAGVSFTNVTNGGVYSGATTGTLTITGARLDMTGYRYKDSIYSTACSSFVNTNAATLTVNANPTISLNASASALYPGLTSTLTATVSPNAAAAGGFTWYRNGEVIQGATAASLPIDVDGIGEYTVSVTDVNGCDSTSTSLSITDAANDRLFIYPNPSTGKFQVRYYSTTGNAGLPRMINVFDSKGTRVYSSTYLLTMPYSRMDVDLSNLSRGIYTVELSDRNGARIKTGRVLIQ